MNRKRLLSIFGAFGVATLLHLNDDVLRFTSGKAILLGLFASDTVIGPRISTSLMRKCVSQDTSAFTRSDIAQIDPELPEILDRATISEVLRVVNSENDPTLQDARERLEKTQIDELLGQNNVHDRKSIEALRYWYDRAISDAHHSATKNARNARIALSGGDAQVLINTLSAHNFMSSIDIDAPFDSDSLDFERGSMNKSAMISDFSRAMGSFTVVCEDGNCWIIDYFDFDISPGPFDLGPSDTNLDRVINAFHDIRRGYYDEAARSIGQIFCHEGSEEQPTSTSIPISISINLTPE